MAEQLLAEFEFDLGALTLIPGGGGRFEVIAAGDLVYSKLATGRHAEYEEVAAEIRRRLASPGSGAEV